MEGIENIQAQGPNDLHETGSQLTMNMGLCLPLLSSNISSLESITFPVFPLNQLYYQNSNFKRLVLETSTTLKSLSPERNIKDLTTKCGTDVFKWSSSN